jgi:hypothetical protein
MPIFCNNVNIIHVKRERKKERIVLVWNSHRKGIVFLKFIYIICFQDLEYNLGFGVKTTSPKEAGELLMKREYPEILNSTTKPHDVIFIPESYLYGTLIEKVLFS